MTPSKLRVRVLRAAYRTAWASRKVVLAMPFFQLDGASVAVWCGEHVLIVRNSYNDYFTVPGGRQNRGETFPQTAARELREETGIDLSPAHLQRGHAEDLRVGWRHYRVEVYETRFDARPPIDLDPVEIGEAHWWTLDEALQQPLFGPTRRYLMAVRDKKLSAAAEFD